MDRLDRLGLKWKRQAVYHIQVSDTRSNYLDVGSTSTDSAEVNKDVKKSDQPKGLVDLDSVGLRYWHPVSDSFNPFDDEVLFDTSELEHFCYKNNGTLHKGLIWVTSAQNKSHGNAYLFCGNDASGTPNR